jgi:hypothetical protein
MCTLFPYFITGCNSALDAGSRNGGQYLLNRKPTQSQVLSQVIGTIMARKRCRIHVFARGSVPLPSYEFSKLDDCCALETTAYAVFWLFRRCFDKR